MKFPFNTIDFPSLKRYKLSQSNAGKIVNEFNKTKVADSLWNYLRIDPSFKFVFSSLIKSGSIDLTLVHSKLPNFLETAKVSFIYEAHCKKCGIILDRKHTLDSDEEMFKNNITCRECKTNNKIKKINYIPNFKPDPDDLIRVLIYGCQENIFSLSHIIRCYSCNITSPLSNKSLLKIECPQCNQLRLISSTFMPLDEHLQTLMKDKQGHWFEWYILRLLKENNYVPLAGLELKENEMPSFECDLLLFINKKIICIECKDSNDTSFISKIHNIEKFADYYILISTTKLNQDTLATIKKIFGRGFIYIEPKDIEKLPVIIKKKIKNSIKNIRTSNI